MKALASATAALMIAATANATPLIDDHSTNNEADAAAAASNTNVNAPVTVNTNTAKGGNAEAEAVNFNANVAKGGDVYRSGNSSNKNTNRQHQGQDQSQRQSQKQGIYDSGNSSVSIINPRDPVASATASQDNTAPCIKSLGLGIQAISVGGSIAIPVSDDVCEGLAIFDRLVKVGYSDAAVRVLCLKDDDTAKALGEAICSGQTVVISQTPPAASYEPMTPVPNPNN